MSCTLCHNAMSEGEWCRACGDGRPSEAEPVEPMSPLRVAIRDAGGFLSTDSEHERAAYHAAKARPGEASL